MNPYVQNTITGVTSAAIVFGVYVAAMLVRVAGKLMLALIVFAGALFLLVRFVH
jgi:hypothetical protein